MKHEPVLINEKNLNAIIDPQSLPQGVDWSDPEYQDETGYPRMPEGWYLVTWPEHVSNPLFNSDCTIGSIPSKEVVFDYVDYYYDYETYKFFSTLHYWYNEIGDSKNVKRICWVRVNKPDCIFCADSNLEEILENLLCSSSEKSEIWKAIGEVTSDGIAWISNFPFKEGSNLKLLYLQKV